MGAQDLPGISAGGRQDKNVLTSGQLVKEPACGARMEPKAQEKDSLQMSKHLVFI
jgi:hypothetical protein